MKPGYVRIIGGMWRGRRLLVPQTIVRPTPDRVRETVFNWLNALLPGAYCLDAFAGSGAFGFEALSRGASGVVMLDQSLKVVDLLKKESETLAPEARIEIYCAKVPEELRVPEKKFDIVFLDPPYGNDLLLATAHYLEENAFLSDNAYIYLESNTILNPEELPSSWSLIKHKKAGQVAYHLAQRLL